MLRAFKIGRMQKKKDVKGLLKVLLLNANKNDVELGKAVIALSKIGEPSVSPICNLIPSIKDSFVKFTLIRILYNIGDPSCKDCLINEVKEFLDKNKSIMDGDSSHGEKSAYYITVKTLKHLNIPPIEWGISSEPYYTRVRSDYEKSES